MNCPSCKQGTLAVVELEPGLKARQCKKCDGVWFDRNEWQTLLSRGLHHKVHEFFTDYYQNQVLREEFRARLEKIYAEKFGAPDYEKIKSIKDWIDNHPLRRIILSFLQDEDPYED
jgi:Zn-finger nucleic acid-binding protein